MDYTINVHFAQKMGLRLLCSQDICWNLNRQDVRVEPTFKPNPQLSFHQGYTSITFQSVNLCNKQQKRDKNWNHSVDHWWLICICKQALFHPSPTPTCAKAIHDFHNFRDRENTGPMYRKKWQFVSETPTHRVQLNTYNQTKGVHPKLISVCIEKSATVWCKFGILFLVEFTTQNGNKHSVVF